MSSLVRARTWTAHTPQELMMDRDMYRYEAEQDRLKREMKRDTRRLNRIYSDAADSRMAAANAMRMSSRYDHDYRDPLLGHGMHSSSVPAYGIGQGMLASPMASRMAMDRRVAVETLRTQRAMDMLSLQERQQQRELLRMRDLEERQIANATRQATMLDAMTPMMPLMTPMTPMTPLSSMAPLGADLPYRQRRMSLGDPLLGSCYMPQSTMMRDYDPYALDLPSVPTHLPGAFGDPLMNDPLMNMTPYSSSLPYRTPGSMMSRSFGTPAMGFMDPLVIP